MKKGKKNSRLVPTRPRTNKITFLLNDEESKFVRNYLEKSKITNRSHWLRETIISHIFKKLDEDYPTLFNEKEMRG